LKYLHSIDQNKYHYIIGGAGLSGLTLAYKMHDKGLLKNKKLLLIDPSQKTKNDRTWSSWYKKLPGLTNLPIKKEWKQANFRTINGSHLENISPYKYGSIEGIDYYDFVKAELTKNENIDWLLSEITSDEPEIQMVTTNAGKVAYDEYFFKSNFYADELPFLISKMNFDKYFLWQHFLGYKVRFKTPMFKPEQFTYMDLRVPQRSGLSFVYVLPESPTLGLIEYTLFNQEVLERQTYEQVLDAYILENYGTSDYEIESVEYNKIPMTTALNEKKSHNRIPIGTLAGVVKASTGYTFIRNQQHTDFIVKQLSLGKKDFEFKRSMRHTFFDKVLINVLAVEVDKGQLIFSMMLEKNGLKFLFKFLNEETSIWEDFKIMNSVPKWPFIKSVWRSFFY